MILLEATYISKDYSYLTYACLNIRTKCHLPDKMTQPECILQGEISQTFATFASVQDLEY